MNKEIENIGSNLKLTLDRYRRLVEEFNNLIVDSTIPFEKRFFELGRLSAAFHLNLEDFEGDLWELFIKIEEKTKALAERDIGYLNKIHQFQTDFNPGNYEVNSTIPKTNHDNVDSEASKKLGLHGHWRISKEAISVILTGKHVNIEQKDFKRFRSIAVNLKDPLDVIFLREAYFNLDPLYSITCYINDVKKEFTTRSYKEALSKIFDLVENYENNNSGK